MMKINTHLKYYCNHQHWSNSVSGATCCFWRPKKKQVAQIEQEEQCKKYQLRSQVFIVLYEDDEVDNDDDDWETMMQGSN